MSAADRGATPEAPPAVGGVAGGCAALAAGSGGGGRRPGRPRDARAGEVILRAACCLLAEVGASGFTVDEVATRAGVGKATIYRRWASRTELLLAAAQEAAIEADEPDTGSLHGDLVALLLGLSAKLEGSPAGRMLPSVIAEAAVNPELRELMPHFFQHRRRAASRVVERGIARGELPAGTDPVLVLDLVGGPILVRHLMTRMPVDRSVVEQVVDTALRGFAGAAPG